MGESLAFGLVQTVMDNLGSPVLQEAGLVWGLKDDLDCLGSLLATIQSVLKDAELKQRKIHAVRDWLGKLKDAAYDAEDILDQVAIHGLKRKLDRETGNTRQLSACFSMLNPLAFKLRIAHKVKCIRKRLEEIAHESLKFHLAEGEVLNNRIENAFESRQSSSLVNVFEIYGRNEERDLIVEKLVSDIHGTHDLSVYAICGMGGIGKTTLAQLLYNDDKVKGHFELRIWVCVSTDFSTKKLVKSIIESTGDTCVVSELDPMQRLLQEKLRGKRYLLVLDDIWSEEDSLWESLKETLNCGAEGSVVMVTTRIEKVATMMDATYTHHLEYLSFEDSWLLFKERAFATEYGENGELKTIGEDIVKRCGGVPLAVKALGSLMRCRSTRSEWLEIQESEFWQVSDEENSTLPALRLSYNDLTPQMRRCFAYSCIFPKDYKMCEDELVQLWIANGFVRSVRKENLPSAARWIFQELVWRSFFQNVRKDSRGKVVCQMHDLMHDLAESVMRHETCIFDRREGSHVPIKLRHMSFEERFYWVELYENKLKLPKSLRSFYGQDTVSSEFDFHFSGGVYSILSKEQHLRVLCSKSILPDKLSTVICKLEHLRYLAMSCNGLERLSESLIRLQNLQTLKLTDSDDLRELPKGLKYLRNLYFLEMESHRSLVCTPPGLGEMTCLQELGIFIVGQDSAHQICQLTRLNLGGHLSIKGLENVRSFEDAQRANLIAKANLKSLELSWTEESKEDLIEYKEILEGLEPTKNLEKLKIKLYQATQFPKWISTLNFNNLDEITLEACRECVCIPPFGKLPSLAVLELKSLTAVKRLDAEWAGDGDRSFPTLKRLIIEDMPNLEEWIIQESVLSFPCLTDLEIKGCPELIALPSLPALKSLHIELNKNMSLLKSISSFTSVTKLRLAHISGSDVLPEGLLQNMKDLRSLEILDSCIRSLSNELDILSLLRILKLSECPNLEVLPRIRHSLESLSIAKCHSLTSIPATILEDSPLVDLTINDCMKLKYPLCGPLHTASSTLQGLYINECPELESLPESIQQLTALGTMQIYNCEKLCALPNSLGALQSLQQLGIVNCEKLESVPDCFHSLKSLQMLFINGCPVLESQCARPKGVDWPKISQIPNIYLGRRKIQ